MPISTVVQRGQFAYVYNSDGRIVCSIPTGSSQGDGLKGYTSTTVSILRGAYIYVYNEAGQIIQTIPNG